MQEVHFWGFQVNYSNWESFWTSSPDKNIAYKILKTTGAEMLNTPLQI